MTDRETAIIEVLMTDDGHFTYKLRSSSSLNTKHYSQILLALAADIGEMFQSESEGKLDKDIVYRQILAFMKEAMDEDLIPETNLRMLQ